MTEEVRLIELPDWSETSKVLFKHLYPEMFEEVYGPQSETIDITHEVVNEQEPLRLEQIRDMKPSD